MFDLFLFLRELHRVLIMVRVKVWKTEQILKAKFGLTFMCIHNYEEEWLGHCLVPYLVLCFGIGHKLQLWLLLRLWLELELNDQNLSSLSQKNPFTQKAFNSEQLFSPCILLENICFYFASEKVIRITNGHRKIYCFFLTHLWYC